MMVGLLASGLLLGLFLGLFAAVWWAPRRVMRRAYRRWLPVNTWVHGPVAAGTTEAWVPLANPDVMPSRAAFDLRRGPLVLSGPVPPDTYWSLTGYDHRSVHFLLRTYRQDQNRFEVALVRRGDRVARRLAASRGLPVHESPGRRGYLLQRTVIDIAADNSDVECLRRQCRIDPL